jgi:hypothetical protein
MFDWGGYRDDLSSLIVDDDNNYVVGGMKIPIDTWVGRAALAKVSSNGQVLWKWICERETTGISQFGIVINDKMIVMIGSYNPPYQIYYFSGDNIINKRNVNNWLALTMNRSNGVILGAEYGISYPKIYIYDLNNLETMKSFTYHSYAADVGGLDMTTNKIFICGIDYSSTGQWNAALYAKLFDTSGNELWYFKENDVSRANGIYDKTESVYITYTEPSGKDFVTVKLNNSGEEMWKRRWNGYPRYNTSEVSWVRGVIEYPTGGCVAIGSLGKDSVPNPAQIWNWTDFGIICYDNGGNEIWSIRDHAQPGWVRNDLWGAAWDKEKYLITAGVARQYDGGKRYVVVQKWFVPGVTGVEHKPNTNPENYELYQNYPNPFNPTTTIRFTIPHRSNVTLKVYDMLGKEIATLVDEEKNPGSYEVKFDASNLPSGVYFYKIKAGEFTQTKKMILMK